MTIFDVDASSALSLTQNATVQVVYDVDASSSLALAQTASQLTVRALVASSPLTLNQVLVVGRPWYLSATSILQETRLEFDPGTLELVEVIVGLNQSVGLTKTLGISASNQLVLGNTAQFALLHPGGTNLSAESILVLNQSAVLSKTPIGSSELVLGQVATVTASKPLSSALTLDQTAGVKVDRTRAASSALALSQSVGYVLVPAAGPDFCKYNPFVGGGPIPPTLQGPYPGVTSRFALIYPATGAATDTVQLRPPNLGNKDRLSFDRVNRETRGGTLIVFADPIWPKVQTLVLNFSALCREDADEVIRFMRDHIGQEIKLSDWEQRLWKGVITTPDEPIIQDGKESFSASFEFEGELLPP